MKWNGRHMELPSTLCSNVYDFALLAPGDFSR